MLGMGTAVPKAEEAGLQELASAQGQQRHRLWLGLAPPAAGHGDQPCTPAPSQPETRSWVPTERKPRTPDQRAGSSHRPVLHSRPRQES